MALSSEDRSEVENIASQKITVQAGHLLGDLLSAVLNNVFSRGTPLSATIRSNAAGFAARFDGLVWDAGSWWAITVAGFDPILISGDAVRALLAASGPDSPLSASNSLAFTLAQDDSPTAVVFRAGRDADNGALLAFSDTTGRIVAAEPLARLGVVSDDTLTGAGTAASPLGVAAGTELPPARLEISSEADCVAQIKLLPDQIPEHGPDYQYVASLLETVRAQFVRRLKPAALGWPEVSLAASMTVARLYALRGSPLGVQTADGVLRVMQSMDIKNLLDGAWQIRM